MNETLRTAVLSVGIFSMLAGDRVDECKRGEMCGAVAGVGQHNHEHNPAPTQTFQGSVRGTTASSWGNFQLPADFLRIQTKA